MKIKNTGRTVDINNAKKFKKFQGTEAQWDREVRGRGLSQSGQQIIDNMPRVETKSHQNEELLAQLKEENDTVAAGHRLPNSQLMRDNEAQRWGKPMHYMTFLKRLRAAGLKVWYNEVPWEGIIGLKAVRKGYEQLGPQFVCGVKMGWTTEYDIFHYDSHGVELNRRFIGWRTVLLAMIGKGIITEKKAHELFGNPQLCDASVLYRKGLNDCRNHR